jgi:hypothetical protein
MHGNKPAGETEKKDDDGGCTVCNVVVSLNFPIEPFVIREQ